MGPIDKFLALIQIKAWCRLCDKPLSEAMMVSLRTDICVTRPQLVNGAVACKTKPNSYLINSQLHRVCSGRTLFFYLYGYFSRGNWLYCSLIYYSHKLHQTFSSTFILASIKATEENSD